MTALVIPPDPQTPPYLIERVQYKAALRAFIVKAAEQYKFDVEFGHDAFGGAGLDIWRIEVAHHLETIGPICAVTRCLCDDMCACRCTCKTPNGCASFECCVYGPQRPNDFTFSGSLEQALAYLQGYAVGRVEERAAAAAAAIASRKAHEHKPIPGCPLDHYHGAPALGNACVPPDEPPDESS